MKGFFFRFIIKRKNRQGLLNLVLLGLLLSSMSLLILQSIMGGLQNNLKGRSKNIIGEKIIILNLEDNEVINSLMWSFKRKGIRFRFENEHEGLVKFKDIITPVVLHGVFEGSSHDPLKNGPYVPYELLDILTAYPGASLEFYSPSYTDSFFSDLPRSFSFLANDIVTTRVPEFDNSHVWLSARKLSNFMRKIKLNRIRIYDKVDDRILEEIFSQSGLNLKSSMIYEWEDLNTSLVWALSLEKIMMTFLFSGMCFLVCLSISSAVLVFIKKVNIELTALWVLGTSKKSIFEGARYSLLGICLLSIILGTAVGTLFLISVNQFSGNVMPDIFVERKIPIRFDIKMYFTSIIIPSFLSFVFVNLSLSQFKNDTDYLKSVRSVGQG